MGAWDDVGEIAPWWLAAMAILQVATLACLWALQRIAIHARAWQPVITSQLAGNALSKVAPGGGAMGAALQYRMLVQAGVDGPRAVGGLTAANLLTFARVVARAVMVVPAIIRGVAPHDLVTARLIGGGAFIVLAIVGAICLATDG